MQPGMVRAAYTDEETRSDAIRDFRIKVLDCVDKVAKFCNIKNLHFEKLLCSLIIFSKNIEGILYDTISSRMIEKAKRI